MAIIGHRGCIWAWKAHPSHPLQAWASSPSLSTHYKPTGPPLSHLKGIVLETYLEEWLNTKKEDFEPRSGELQEPLFVQRPAALMEVVIYNFRQPASLAELPLLRVRTTPHNQFLSLLLLQSFQFHSHFFSQTPFSLFRTTVETGRRNWKQILKH